MVNTCYKASIKKKTKKNANIALNIALQALNKHRRKWVSYIQLLVILFAEMLYPKL